MAVIGYYSMGLGAGDPGMVDDILAAGHTPLRLETLSPAELGQIDTLYVWNGSNSGYGQEFLNAMPQISAAVAGGMNMVMFDRAIGVANPTTVLPGTSLTVMRHLSADADLTDAGEDALGSGPGGVVTDSTIDGGNYTTHGYVNASSLPAGAEVLMTTGGGNPDHAVGFIYDFGAGSVQFYGIPMDFYNENKQAWENLAINSLNVATPMCLAAPTRVLTPRGPRPALTLRPGDLVWTRDHGYQPLRHVLRHAGQEPLLHLPPALTGGRRGLVLSARHRLLLASPRLELWTGATEALAPALALRGLARVCPPQPLVNLLFDRHEIIAAEGVLVESLHLGREAGAGLPRAAWLALAALPLRSRATRPCRPFLRLRLAQALIRADLAEGRNPLIRQARAGPEGELRANAAG